MGFALSVVYVFINYLTPAYLFGSLADLHIEVIIVALIVIVSLPALMNSFLLKIPQSLAMIGLTVAVFLSVLFGSRGFDGAVQAFLLFIPSGVPFFFVCLHCNTTRRFKILVLTMLLVCLFVIARGSFDLLRGIPQNTLQPEADSGNPIPTSMTGSKYFLKQGNGEGGWVYRLQWLGEINDPNDTGQLIVCVMPLIFIFWREKKTMTNIFFVILPVCALLFGAYLTHSRGSLLALSAIVIVAARRRIGTLPAVLLVSALISAAFALQFTGGREISASAGEDRTALWGESLQLLKSHPLLGVGFAQLGDQMGLTAHNSVAVCAAELGLFGLFFWSLFLFPTMRNALATASPDDVHDGEPIPADESRFPQTIMPMEEIDKAEINRLGQLMFLSLTGYLVAGWFLSRAFIMTLFLLGGMTEAVYEMALRRGMIAPRLRHERVLSYSGLLAAALVLMLYLTVRVLHLSS
jgi:hypothetical protein